jgi:hypothetical protein
MITVIHENYSASEWIMTMLMSVPVQLGAEVGVIQEPSKKTEEDKWKVNI